MPLKPVRVMTLKGHERDSTMDKFIIVSFEDSSLILGIEDGKISAIEDSGFTKGEPTLHAGLMEDGSYVQVTPTSIVHIRQHVAASLKNTKWSCDPKRKIFQACSNQRQVILQIESDQLICFELDF